MKRGFFVVFFLNCFLSAYAESSRTEKAISFKSSNKNSMLYHPLSFQMERRDNNKPAFTRYTVILLFYHIPIHLNRESTMIHSFSNNLVYYN
ncbi:hypothetical protein BAH_A0144 (plasmid) [Bacillus anthracis str. A0442]|nr:hypothetical protein BAH_A0144 [Bacillus anthracis str. A0442]